MSKPRQPTPSPYPAVLASALFMVLAGISLFSSAGRDDAYITYGAARGLIETGRLVNFTGQTVEQSSSLLHVLVLAVMGRLTGLRVEAMGPFISIGAGILTVIASTFLVDGRREKIITAMLLSMSAGFVYWSVSGMETTLFTLVSVLLVTVLKRAIENPENTTHIVLAFVIIPLFLISRPESPVVLITAAAALVLLFMLYRRTQEAARAAWIIAGTSLAVGLLFLWRYGHSGNIFPQPVLAKSDLSPAAVLRGLIYVAGELAGIRRYEAGLKLVDPAGLVFNTGAAAAYVYAGMLLFREKPGHRIILYSWVFTGVYGAFIVASGGDWMEGGRFLAHIQPFIIATAVYALHQLPGKRFVINGVAGTAAGLLAVSLVSFAVWQSTGMPVTQGIRQYQTYPSEYRQQGFGWFEVTNRIHLRDIPTIVHLNRIIDSLNTPEKPLVIMSGQMGMVPYFAIPHTGAAVRLLDLHGLVTDDFTRCPITADREHTAVGLAVDYDFFFSNSDTLAARCNIPLPDIIYDLAGVSPALVSQNGYQIVYAQHGAILSGSAMFPGDTVNGSQFIAVRADRTDELDALYPVVVDMSELYP